MGPHTSKTDVFIQCLQQRALPEGGFADQPGGIFSPDCTAWAVIGMHACGIDNNLTQQACERLTGCQHKDGRINLLPDHPETYWPTALTVMAWSKDQRFKAYRDKAAEFLLACTGLYFESDGEFKGNDTLLKGWPWIPGTFSWVVPTSLAVLALQAAGHADHGRTHEAIRLLADRQLAGGGWNFGSQLTFTTDLLPIPEVTGHALNALKGNMPRGKTAQSILYLKQQAPKIRTPLTLSWAILGLAAWKERPAEADTWLLESFELQKRYGDYRTDLIAQLATACSKPNGL